MRDDDLRYWQREQLPEGFVIAALAVAILSVFACVAIAHALAWWLS